MKILFAEDESMFKEACSRKMEDSLNCEITCVSDGEQAINHLKKSNDYDLVLCDYNMPHKNGGEVYIYIKENYPNIPFILISNDLVEDYVEFATFKQDNPKNFSFLKPINLEAIIVYIKLTL